MHDSRSEGELIDWLLNRSVLGDLFQIRERSNHNGAELGYRDHDGQDHGDKSVTGNQVSGNPRSGNLKHVSLPFDDLDPLMSEDLSSFEPVLRNSVNFSPHSGVRLIHSGEIRTVQDRFHAILKRRFQAEIQRNPPLFPWETEVTDYEYEQSDAAVGALSPGSWITQLRNLNLPIALPEPVLAELLGQCRRVVQLSLLEGAKLVQAVEALFPGHEQDLNSLAGVVLLGASRSPALTQEDLPASFDAASPHQQMVLSMLAAKQLIDTLTVKVSAVQPTAEREWMTEAGLLTLATSYQSQGEGGLKVQGRVPCAASLVLRSGEVETQASRLDPGYLSVELLGLQPNQTYPLEVYLQGGDQQPLVFAVCPSAGA